MFYKMSTSDHRSINIATERVATLSDSNSYGSSLTYYEYKMPSGRLLIEITLGENWVDICGYPVRNGRPDWTTKKVYAHQGWVSEDRSELDKALNILKWLLDVKTMDFRR